MNDIAATIAWRFNDFDPGTGKPAGAHTLDYPEDGWLPVSVPGDLHTALIAAGRLPDPYYDRNEEQAGWVEGREWWLRGTFEAPPRLNEPDERFLLTFHGIDTRAILYMNGELMGRSQNMFREAVYDVTRRLRPGKNVLVVRIDPPLGKVDAARAAAGAVAENMLDRAFVRKAQYGWGWDWGPRLPSVGLWRPVELKRYHHAALLDVHFATLHIETDARQAAVRLQIDAARFDGGESLKADVKLTIPGEKKPVYEETVTLDVVDGALQRSTLMAAIDHPRLWWTHDLGEPNLYELRVVLRKGKDVLDRYEQAVGIRTIALDQSPDPAEPGTRFFRFVLNGLPIFARGANWIPAHSFVADVPEARYEDLIGQAQEARMNMLRVWGGGVYEREIFYETCDRLGILVWQDFMFACADYPENDAFAVEIAAEARYQVRRLRNYPCMALWCGNNENQWIHDQMHPFDPGNPVPGALYYDQILPRAVTESDGFTPYWPGSPYGGDDYNDQRQGDRHNWRSWHGMQDRRFGDTILIDQSPEGVSYRHYEEDMGRFISEFGLHAAPVKATLARALPADQLYHHSPGMDAHNKDNPKNKGDHLMESSTGLPGDLEEYIDFSMIAQAEGLKFGIDHFRRRKPHCSGTLVWQLNDSWPALSWSLIDFDGVGKAGYYYVRRAYALVVASFARLADGGAELWMVNDTREDLEDTILIRLAEFSGAEIWKRELSVVIRAGQSMRVSAFDAQELAASPSRYLSARSTGSLFPTNRLFFSEIKDLDRPVATPQVAYTVMDAGLIAADVTAPADAYVYFAHFLYPAPDTRFSDNYFDLEPGETRTIFIAHPAGLDLDALEFKHR